jgi:hypothetical protein
MRDLSYAEALRALNRTAWDAVTASKGIVTEDNPDYRALRELARETDRLVDELPSRVDADYRGEVPALRSALVQGARI